MGVLDTYFVQDFFAVFKQLAASVPQTAVSYLLSELLVDIQALALNSASSEGFMRTKLAIQPF